MKDKIIITTQPADQAAEMIRLLSEKGANAFSMPLIHTQPLDLDPQILLKAMEPGAFDLLIFTSKKGVQSFFKNLEKVTESFSLPETLKIAVVGKSTALELEQFNQKPHYINPGTNAYDLSEYLISNKIIKPSIRVLLALGNRAPDYLEEAFGSLAKVSRINVYETITLNDIDPEISALILQGKAEFCIFTSPSAFEAFTNLFGRVEKVKFAAIGTTTAAAISSSGYTVTVTPDYPGSKEVVEALEAYFKLHF